MGFNNKAAHTKEKPKENIAAYLALFRRARTHTHSHMLYVCGFRGTEESERETALNINTL